MDAFALLASCHDPGFGDFLRIYEESLPVREQKPVAQISALIGRRDYRVFLLRRDGQVAGFSIVFATPAESFCLLEYCAIHEACRNRGLGRKLFLHSIDGAAGKANPPVVLLEVDSSREASADMVDMADAAMRERRQQFYRRLGCLRIDKLPYILPLPGEGTPPEMDLMAHFPNGIQAIRKDQLRHWLELIYREVYDCGAEDPRIATMLAAVSDPVGIL